MKKIYFLLLLIIGIAEPAFSQLNPKLIASKYSKGIVKVILFDPELEKAKPGSGYLGRGSGFFVTADGYIFTNRHVVETCVKGYVDYDYMDENNQKKAGFSSYSEDLISNKNFIKAYNAGYTVPIIQVFTGDTENDYKLYIAKVVAIGMGAFDGALLKVVSDEQGASGNFNFTALPIGNSDDVHQGEQLCVYGFPQQIAGAGADVMLRDLSTLSLGIMSGYDFVFNKDYGFIKTDAGIHPGNSGGPVFGENNKVIGIATSIGLATGIGLVGGINGMFYISATDGDAQQKLISLGLKPPKRSFSINTITGERQPMKTVDEINDFVQPNKVDQPNKDTMSSEDIYKNSTIYFSNVSALENNNKLPGASQQYKTFIIDKKSGGKVWVYVDNYPTPLNTKQIIVLIDQLENGEFKKLEDLVFDITGTLDFTYFPYSFYKKGTYRFTIYSKEMKYINSSKLDLVYK